MQPSEPPGFEDHLEIVTAFDLLVNSAEAGQSVTLPQLLIKGS